MLKNNITLLTLDYPPDRGGVARYLSNLVDESGGTISVLVPEGHAADGPGRVGTANIFRGNWPKWWPLVSLIQDLGRRASDVILISHVFPVGTAAWIARLQGGPEYAVIFHGLDLKLARGIWKRWLLRRICRGAKSLFTNSRAVLDELRQLVPGAEATVLTPGIKDAEVLTREEARQRLGLDVGRKVVLSVTRLVPRKGIDYALRAMARVQMKRDAEYVVLGDGPDKERLQEIADESRTKVRWITNADDEEKWLWYAAADVFLLPVREDEDDMEGFGIVYLEAALAGVPSVAGKSGGAGEAVKHDVTGLLVKPDSTEEIEEAVEKLLANSELSTKLGRQGRERAMVDFRWADRWHTVKAALGIKD